MPHRHQELVELCRECKAPATTACEHCGTPLCYDHQPVITRRRCMGCEAQFVNQSQALLRAARGEHGSRSTNGYFAAIFAAVLGPFALMAFGSGSVGIGVVLSVLTVGCVAAAAKAPPSPDHARHRIRVARQKFLDRTAKNLLPPGPDEADEDRGVF